jgi:hypothetical protein
MELEHFLQDVVSDLRNEADARRLAGRLLSQWNAGIVPAPREVNELRRRLKKVETCGRLRPDGSCAWLRRNAKSEGLRPPKPGQKVLCRRRATGKAANTFVECPGYRKESEES